MSSRPILGSSLIVLALSSFPVVCALAGEASLEPISGERIARVSAWLQDEPEGFCESAAHREAWEALAKRADFAKVIGKARELAAQSPPELADADFLAFKASGDRKAAEIVKTRLERLNTLALAEALEYKGHFLPPIERELNAILSEKTWVASSMDPELDNFRGERFDVDLDAAMRAWTLATVSHLLEDRLPGETRERIRTEVRRRVLEPYLHILKTGAFPQGKRGGWWWLTGENNWNPVCLAGVTGAGLALLPSREDRATLLAGLERYLPNYAKGIPADGYCSEGVMYWGFGVGHYLLAAELASRATHGRIDLYKDPAISRAAEYPQRLEMSPGLYPAYADTRLNPRPSPWVLEFLQIKLHLGREDWVRSGPTSDEKWVYTLGGTMALNRSARQETPPPGLPPRSELPSGGVFTFRPLLPAEGALTVSLKGGDNGEFHNHNDIGTFVVGVGSEALVIDPGHDGYGPEAWTNARYTNPLRSSRGHSVPVVAGELQRAGKEFRGRVLEQSFSPGKDTLVMDLREAYSVPSLKQLRRTLTYERQGPGRLIVCDTVEFNSPQSFETAFVTAGEVEVIEPGRLRIRGNASGVEILIRSEGAQFEVCKPEELSQKRKVRRIGVRLIAAVPKGMIEFEIRPL